MSDPFALENFAPSDTRFTLSKHGDTVFVVDGDPDTADIARMLSIEERLGNSSSEREIIDLGEEGKALLLRMVQERDPTVTELRVGVQELLLAFSLIVRGESVVSVVAQRILSDAPAGENDEPAKPRDAEAGEDGEAGGGADVTPLRSERSSPEPSSGSATRDDGLPATGTA